MNKNERTQYVDVMKGFGILLVVLLHSIGYVRRGTPLPDVYSWRLEEWLHSFLMPYFVFVNGYIFNLFYVKKRLEGAAKIKNYFSRLLQIYLIFNSIMITVKMVFSKFTVDKIGGGGWWLNILLPDTSMWYIWFLLIMSLIYYNLLYFKVSFSIYQEVLSLFFLTNLSIFLGGPLNLADYPIGLQHLTSLPIFYILGTLVSKYSLERYLCPLPKLVSLVSMIYIVFYIVLLLELKSIPVSDLYIYTLIRYLNGFFMILLVTAIILKEGNTGYCRVIAKLGEKSLYIYLLHTYLLAVFNVIISKVLSGASLFLKIFLVFTLTLLICLIIVRIIDRFPLLKRLFGGRIFFS